MKKSVAIDIVRCSCLLTDIRSIYKKLKYYGLVIQCGVIKGAEHFYAEVLYDKQIRFYSY